MCGWVQTLILDYQTSPQLRLDKKGDARAGVAFNLIKKNDLYSLLPLSIDGDDLTKIKIRIYLI